MKNKYTFRSWGHGDGYMSTVLIDTNDNKVFDSGSMWVEDWKFLRY